MEFSVFLSPPSSSLPAPRSCFFSSPPRVLSSPQEAARFVSLLPYERADMSTEMGRQETWHSLHTFVSRQRGLMEFLPPPSLIPHSVGSVCGRDTSASTHTPLMNVPPFCAGGVESHAQLLCSLLLGFGLNAYMCLGTVCGFCGVDVSATCLTLLPFP